ncbi:MAG: DUF308 domain-containing protein [Actinomycetota bacterium]|nr:DUF308 domain-containing protein [Actinomycetota bacterium]
MIERDGDTVRLVQDPRGVAVANGTVSIFGVVVAAFGVFAAISPVLGVSAYVEILAVALIGAGVAAIVGTVRGGKDHELVELDATTLRVRRGDQVLHSVSRTSVASLQLFVSAGQGGVKTSVLLTAYGDGNDIVAQWPLETPWSKKRFDEFHEATGIPAPSAP